MGPCHLPNLPSTRPAIHPSFPPPTHPVIRKKARKAMPFLWFFSFRGENRVSIFAWERFRHLEALLYHNEAVHGTNANLKPTHPANFMQDFESLGLLVLRIYPIK